MAEITNLGVMLCKKNTFTVGADAESATFVAEIENFTPEFETKMAAERNTYDKPLTQRIKVVTGFKVTLNGYRCIGDAGNDFIASKAGKSESEAEGYCKVTLLDGKAYEMPNAVFEVNYGGGATNDGAPLSATIYSNGIINEVTA